MYALFPEDSRCFSRGLREPTLFEALQKNPRSIIEGLQTAPCCALRALGFELGIITSDGYTSPLLILYFAFALFDRIARYSPEFIRSPPRPFSPHFAWRV
jgi:hypothetical protein